MCICMCIYIYIYISGPILESKEVCHFSEKEQKQGKKGLDI